MTNHSLQNVPFFIVGYQNRFELSEVVSEKQYLYQPELWLDIYKYLFVL